MARIWGHIWILRQAGRPGQKELAERIRLFRGVSPKKRHLTSISEANGKHEVRTHTKTYFLLYCRPVCVNAGNTDRLENGEER